MSESIRVSETFSALIAGFRVELYNRTGKLFGIKDTIDIFIASATIDKVKFNAELDKIRKKEKVRPIFPT